MTQSIDQADAGPAMPRSLGIYETHLTVASLSRSVEFYKDIIGLTFAHEAGSRNAAFFWIDDKRTGMLGLWETGSGPMAMRLHMAFRASFADMLAAPAALTARGIQSLGRRGEPISEPVVIGWMPALSVYLADPDGHSIEFIHVLDERPDPAFGVQPYSAWVAR